MPDVTNTIRDEAGAPIVGAVVDMYRMNAAGLQETLQSTTNGSGVWTRTLATNPTDEFWVVVERTPGGPWRTPKEYRIRVPAAAGPHNIYHLTVAAPSALDVIDETVRVPGAMKVRIQDEGVLVGTRKTLNLVGAGVSALDNPGSNRVDITIAGGGGGSAAEDLIFFMAG